MSFPAYSDYKDSGIAWLGDVPSHWDVVQTKRAFRRRKELNTGMICEDRLALTMNGVVPRSLDDVDGLQSNDYEGYQIFEAGDLAFKLIDLQNVKTSRVGMVPERGIMSPAYVRLEPASDTRGRFGYWYFMALYWLQVFNNLGGGVRQTLGPEELLTVPFPLPSEIEQTTIAAFLDRETAKIDALVAEQGRLIALLREKRQAVISHAVTKGLNPDAPMKDSGIEWLGEIPAHWDRLQLGRLCHQVSDGPHFSPPYVDEGILFLSARNIRVDGWSLEDAKYVSEDLYEEFCKRVTPEKGDVLYTKGGTTGIARVVDFDTPFQVWVHVAVLKIHRDLVLPAFVAHSLNSTGCYEQSQLHTRGATNQDLGLTRMIKIWLTLPPIDEQRAIVADLDTRLTVLDEATATASQSISLLEERRAALISAAVTGKIDVRGVVSQSNVVSIDSARRASNLPQLRSVVGAYAIRELGPMGRMAVMKAGYLAEGHAGLGDLNGRYERYAAGPYDQSLIAAMERGAEEICTIVTKEPQDEGKPVTYDVPKGYQPPSDALLALVGEDRATGFLALLILLKGIGRDGVEAVATLYAVWNDLLAASKAANDDAICNGVLIDWHPEKAKKFKRADLDHWLDWMRRNGLVPDGSAPRTDNQGILFA